MNAYRQNEQQRALGGTGWRPDGATPRLAPAPSRAKPSLVASATSALRSSRRVRLLAALALVVVCAMAVPVLVTALSPKPTRVLAAVVDLPAGTVITQSDLKPVQATGPAGVMVPAADQASMIGQTVRVEVPAGALLNQADLGQFPPIGASVVPVAVKPGQYPSNLQTGQQVAVFPVATGTSSQTSTAAHAAATGTVIEISPAADDDSGEVVIDLEVTSTAAAVVAQAPAVVLVGLDVRGDAP